MRQSSPTTFAGDKLVGLQLRPTAKPVFTIRRIGCVLSVIMNNHTAFIFRHTAGQISRSSGILTPALFSEISSLTPAFLPLFGNGLSFRISR
jgi:hypothetical protein